MNEETHSKTASTLPPGDLGTFLFMDVHRIADSGCSVLWGSWCTGFVKRKLIFQDLTPIIFDPGHFGKEVSTREKKEEPLWFLLRV
jgi:hypothetical protein